MRYLACAAVVMVVSGAMAGRGADVSGRWRAEFAGPGGETGVETLELRVRGDVVTGTMTNAVAGVGEVRDGKWDGTTLRFWVPWDGSDRLQAVGRMREATLEVDLKTRQWSAKRVFRPVTGK